MKILILPISFFLFGFIFFSNAYAQDYEACWNTQRDKDAVCGKTNTKCLIDCASSPSNERDSCMKGCNDVSLACYKKNSAEYEACLEAGKKPSTLTPQPSPNLSGTWSRNGKSLTSQQSGNTITILGDQGPETPIFEGTITGNTIEGRQYLTAKTCPSLDHYVDASGTISEDGTTITVTYTSPKYNLEGCFDLAGTEHEDTFTYSKSNPEVSPDVENDQMPEKPPEKPSVGVSSKDFKALARANAEYQKAQADLEQIKQSEDPRWKAKKDVASNPQINSDTFDQELQKVKVVLERTRDGATVLQDIKDLYGLATGGKIGAYGPVSAITDVASGLTTYTEQVGKGVSDDNAFTKTLLDVGAPSAFMAYPPAYVADKVATMPDRVMNALGYPEKQGPRIVTGFLKKNSPSGFVELTTDSMIKTNDWTNAGGVFTVAVDDIRTADGIVAKVNATGDLVATAIGAIPVAAALLLRDTVAITDSMAQDFVTFVYNYFTYSP